MKKLLITIAALSTAGVAAPAVAQYNSGIEWRIEQLQTRIQAGVQNGTITRAEAMVLRERFRALRDLERQLSQNGLTRAERDQLQAAVASLRQQIIAAERNNDRRNPRDRYDDDDDYEYGNGRYCPPGLAKKDNGCMPPGQAKKQGDRYDDNYGQLPPRYRDQFRDTNRYYYRYDNGRVYQIDRRTNTIVRVIDVR